MRAAGVLLAATIIAAIGVGILLRLGAREHVLNLLEILRKIGIWGPLILVLIQAVIVIFILPGILITMGAGFLFGIIPGTMCIVAGNVIGASLSFLIARFFLHKRFLKHVLEKYPRVQHLDERVSRGGWKIIMLTRMIPFFPFKLSNYLFGVMRFSFMDIVIGTAIGSIPITATNVYAGSLAGDLATMESFSQRDPLTWFFYGLGLIAFLVFAVFLGRYAGRRLHWENQS